jgi:hypothetical protein
VSIIKNLLQPVSQQFDGVLWPFIPGCIRLLGQFLDITDNLFLNLPLSSNLLSISVRDGPLATLWTGEIDPCLRAT